MKKQADGRYRTKIKVGNDGDGKPIYKWASSHTKKGLDAQVEELKRSYIAFGGYVKRDVLFSEFAQEWYNAYKKQKIGVSSKTSYSTMFEKHLFPVFGDRQIGSIRALELQTFLVSKAESGLSKSSMDKIFMTLRQVFKNALAQGVIDNDPSAAIVKPGAPEGSRRALTSAETAAVFKVAHSSPDGTLLLTLYYTGARIGEVLGLKWGDIDFNSRMMSIERDLDFKTGQIGGLKTKSAIRKIPMDARLCTALQSQMRGQTDYIFHASNSNTFLSRSTYVRHWEKLMQEVYLADPTIERRRTTDHSNKRRDVEEYASILTPHYFRHNYASILYNANVDILNAKKWLGHSDVKTTLAIYAHLSADREDKNIEALYEAFESNRQTMLNVNS